MGWDLRFHRVASRIAMLTSWWAFLLLARHLKVTDRVTWYGLPRRQFLLELAKAFALGAVLMLPVLVTMVWLDMRELKPGLSLGAAGWAKLIALACMTGLVVALLEETLMRGVMHTAIARESGATAAIVLVSLIYAATHFFAKTRIPRELVDSGSGLDMLSCLLTSFANPLASSMPSCACSWWALLLGLARQLTGKHRGLHRAARQLVAIITVCARPPCAASPACGLPLSDYDGFIGWMVLAWTFVIAPCVAVVPSGAG